MDQQNVQATMEDRPGPRRERLDAGWLVAAWGTGGDSRTGCPIGRSFPSGSGLVALAAATGVMPLDMTENALVRFKDAIHQGLLTGQHATRPIAAPSAAPSS